MPLDAVCLLALRRELEACLVGARVEKVFMPGFREVHLVMRVGNEKKRLLLSSDAGRPRAHLTRLAAENPQSPPMFCMLLRKHLTGARLTAVEQPPLERVLCFRFDATDEIGVRCGKTLIAEMMGRHSNLILVASDGMIIDCLTRVDLAMSERRQVLPGLFYRNPPTQGKLNPLQTDAQYISDMINGFSGGCDRDDWLLRQFCGLSPLVCRELAFRSRNGVGESFSSVVLGWRETVLRGHLEPWVLMRGDDPFEFSYLPIAQYGDAYQCRKMESFSVMLDTFHTRRARMESLRAQARELSRKLDTIQARVSRRLAVQEMELSRTDERESLREKGDLLMANLYAIPAGKSMAELFDFYHGTTCQIPLDPALSVQQNAAAYYRDYRRAKSARVFLAGQIDAGKKELAYIESLAEALSRVESIQDIQDIRQEMVSGGYTGKPKDSTGKGGKSPPSSPMRFVSSTGQAFFAGRNNRQNDLLTLKTAARGDIWLHARNVPGSHVIIPMDGGNGAPDEATLAEAAAVAATLSRASGGGKVPVDYTRASNVKKPPGARPGMVTYSRFKTVTAVPDRQLVDSLRV